MRCVCLSRAGIRVCMWTDWWQDTETHPDKVGFVCLLCLLQGLIQSLCNLSTHTQNTYHTPPQKHEFTTHEKDEPSLLFSVHAPTHPRTVNSHTMTTSKEAPTSYKGKVLPWLCVCVLRCLSLIFCRGVEIDITLGV